jgi:N-methylhydantoinase B
MRESSIRQVSELGQPRALDRLDPVTFEILRHRLWVIQGELGTTIKSMSASPVATEAGDFNTCLMDAQGNGLLIGLYIAGQAATMPWVVRSLLEDYGRDLVRDGDMFLCNDPWKGALHQNDVACVAPVFIDGELVAWVGSVIHQLDVGGPVPGGFALGARSVYDESPVFPAVRIVRDGKIQPDVEAGYLRRSRLEHFMRLDLRAQIGANNIAATRLREVAAQYGSETLRDVFTGMVEFVEHKLRARLCELPAVKFREIVLMDDDSLDPNSLYAIVIDVHNGPDGLCLDFSASSPQAPGLINCARPALHGGIISGVLVQLCYDLPWTPAAIERCVKVVSKAGTVCDATWPAGVSGGSVFAARTVSGGVGNALGRLYSMSGHVPQRAMSGWSVGANFVNIFGARRDGSPFATMLLETAQGLAARATADGMDTGGFPDCPGTSNTNIETLEASYPLLYLFRSEGADTGGAGRYRGGTAASWAFQFYDGLGGQIIAPGQGYLCPLTFGVDGGSPAMSLNSLHVRGVREADMDALHQLIRRIREFVSDTGATPAFRETRSFHPGPRADEPITAERMYAKHSVALKPGDIYVGSGGGGGGFGDPLERPLASVVKDVEQGYVSALGALRDYGVHITTAADGAIGGARGGRCGEAPAASASLPEILLTDGRRLRRVRRVEEGRSWDDWLVLG